MQDQEISSPSNIIWNLAGTVVPEGIETSGVHKKLTIRLQSFIENKELNLCVPKFAGNRIITLHLEFNNKIIYVTLWKIRGREKIGNNKVVKNEVTWPTKKGGER